MDSTVTPAPGADAGTTAPPPLYTRNSSGMVREVSTADMLAYNAAATGGGTGLALVIALFWVFLAYPGANLWIALPAAFLVVGFVWVTFALLTATFPRAGGDYLFGSRVIHPIVGLTSHLALFLSTILAVGVFGAFMVTVGLAPVFTIIGLTTDHQWWLDAAATISQKGWTLAIAALSIGFMSFLSMLRTKLVARVMTWSFVIANIGFFTALAVMLFTRHDSFIDAVNSFSEPFTKTKDTYNATIAAGAEAGLQYPSRDGYSVEGTIGAFQVGIGLFLLSFWGSYMAGEMKGANRRSRQLTTVLGAGYVQGAIVLVAVLIFISTAGYDFFAAASSGAYGVPVAPYYNFFAAIASGSPVLSIIMALTFIGFLFPAMYINSSLVQRSLFAWSFDGILPRKLSSVSDRTRTPVVAIMVIAALGIACAAWFIYGSNVQQVIALSNVLIAPTVLVAGLAGLLLPKRHPHLFENGPADWRPMGIPMLRVCSSVTVVLALVWGGLILYFHDRLGVPGAATMPLALLFCAVVGVGWYAIASAVQRSKGVEMKYVYRTIPPE